MSLSLKRYSCLITGASGFLGAQLIEYLDSKEQLSLRISARSKINKQFKNQSIVLPIMDLVSGNWSTALVGCDVIIHTAARVHVMNETAIDPLSEFRKVNTEGTLNLARQAAEAGVKRFIFISSVKVNGEATFNQNCFSANDTPSPEDAYGISKYEAEQGLMAIADSTGMEVVIIRPPLVYGPGVKGNFNRMFAWVSKAWPLPLAAIKNKRSFVSIDNLINLIELCITHPKAANQIFLVSDGDDLSTPELLRTVSEAIDKPILLLPVPIFILRFFAKLMGKRADFDRLCGSLQLDISKTCERLDWQPKVKMLETLRRMGN